MTDTDKRKIHVDNEWKARVQAEQAAFAMEADGAADPSAQAAGPLQANFGALLSSLATQALMCLGVVADPTTGKPRVDLEVARYSIDMLEVIQEKTKGNLTPEEQEALDSTLLELRMTYLDRTKADPAGAPSPADAQEPSRIITP